MSYYGLSKSEAEEILKESLQKNPDIFYYLDNDYVQEIIELLINGISEVIERNNKKVKSDFYKELRSRGSS